MRQFTVLDLFAGGGGFSAGFNMVKTTQGTPFYKVIKALEIDHDACNTLRHHHGDHKVIEGDITSSEIKKLLVEQCRGVDVIIGGPPCQTFSLAGPARSGTPEAREKLKNDIRNTLYKHFFEIVQYLKPQIVVFENVEGILSKKVDQEDLSDEQNAVIDVICDELEGMGYNPHVEGSTSKRYQVINAADFGVPQHRKRVLIIANRFGVKNPILSRTHGTAITPYRTLQDAIGDLPVILPVMNTSRIDGLKNLNLILENIGNYLFYFVDSLNQLKIIYKERQEIKSPEFKKLHSYINDMYLQLKSTKRCNIQRLKDFIQGYNERLGGLDNKQISEEHAFHSSREHNIRDLIIFSGMRAGTSSAQFVNSANPSYDPLLDMLYPYDRSKHLDTYVKHSWMRPSNTILAHMERDGLKFIHPDQPRTFTPYEASLIQSFPKDYRFCGKRNAQYRQIGNAVPPLLSKRIGEVIVSMLFQINQTNEGELVCNQ